MPVRITTFGGLHVAGDEAELEQLYSRRSRAALLIYLTIERCVSRESVMAMFWPESDAENAAHALRQSLYHVRRLIGGRDWIGTRAHRLVTHGELWTDATAFSDAIERGDAECAARLYGGPFLDGVHLVDRQSWESWVDSRRTRYARAFRTACRQLLDAKLACRHFADAIAVAERWTARTPTDDEAQHRLISALAAAGERAEAIRQFELYARLLERDGLEPPDETRDLVDQLRTRPSRARPPRVA